MSDVLWEADASDARAALDEQGAWFCDDAVSASTAAALREEILGVHLAGLLQQSGNRLAVRTADGHRSGVSRDKPNVFEADVIVNGAVEREDVLAVCPVLRQLFLDDGALRRGLNAARPDLRLDRLEFAKIQVNTGAGGAFPMHFDLSTAKDARRLLTAILYLNPEWEEGWGGEVELLPFPFPNVVVAPVDRRLVVFASNTTMHRVRPFRGPTSRVCINCWFDGDVSVPFPALLPLEDVDARVAKVVRVLRGQPNELRAFCKVWYRDLIAASFRDAFEPCPELDAAVDLHFQEAAEVERRIAPATLELLREHYPLEPRIESAKGLAGLFDDL